MSNINAQTIIAEVMAAHAIAPSEYTWGDFVTFKTSARGSHRVLNCKENLKRFADLVRKNASAFGGGLIKEDKPRPAVSYASKTISLYKQLIEDKDYAGALQLAEEKLAPLFFLDHKGNGHMQVAPIPLDSEPRLVSLLGEDGKWSVCCPVSMLGLDSLTGNKRSRQAQIDAADQHLRVMKPEKKEAMMANAHARPVDQSAARAQWMADHGIVDDEAIAARIEQQAAQDVAEIVAQAVAVSAIAEAMAPAAETESTHELVTCEDGESEAQCVGDAIASGNITVYPNYMVALGLAPACGYTSNTAPTVPTSGGNAGDTTTPAVNIAKFIHVAADSVGTLRKIDVSRVIDEAPTQYRQELAAYIQYNRPDLEQEVADVLEEITPTTTPAETVEQPATRPVESTNFAADIPLSLAVNAFHGVSMSPERRGASAQAGYAQDMAQDYETMRIQAVKGGTLDLLPEVFARYRVRQAVAYRAYLSSSSRCVSSFIAGPSNFPAARMNKRNDIAHKRLNEYLDGGKMAMQAAIRTLRPDLRAIMSGDADAIDRLTIELAKAERSHEQMKAANKAIRANAEAGEAHQVAALMELGFNEPTAVKLLHPMRPYCKGFEGFTLTNSSANIRRLKGRLEQITAAKARPVETVECSNGITFEDDAPANRVRLYFPGKPDDATRSELKSRGFRWSPTLGAWQAYRNYQTITTAKRMAGEPTASAKDEAPEVAEVAPIEDTSPVVESAEITAPAPEPVPVVEIEATTPAAEIHIEPVAHVVGTESPQAAKEPTPTPDDTQKFRVRAKYGEWRASFMMIGTMYALLFNGDGSKVTTTTYATHAERMQALKAKMVEKAKSMKIEDLKSEAAKMAQCFEDYADHVLMALLDALESKVSEQEFVEFCGKLYT